VPIGAVSTIALKPSHPVPIMTEVQTTTMANRYSVLVPSDPQESESCLSEDRAWDLCISLAEEFGYAEVRDPWGNHIGDYGDPSGFFG